MDRRLAALLTLSLLPFPFVGAHDPTGTPRNFCEDPSEWAVHDYSAPASGLVWALAQDGNLLGDCNGDTVPADYDGHSEWALGGGWLAVESGDGVTSGSVVCVGETGHHPVFGPVHVQDAILGRTVPFTVASDFVNVVPPTDPAAPQCGDFETDGSTLCVDECSVTFPPGLDGGYNVFVGHVATLGVGTIGHLGTQKIAEGSLGIPGPLVLNIYWSGTGSEVEWVYEGSFDCDLVLSQWTNFRAECEPQDVAQFHCVNPGVAAAHSGMYYTDTRIDLECGSLTPGCQTPSGFGSCQDGAIGEVEADIVCRGQYRYITGDDDFPNYPPAMHVTCYSDPPALAPKGVAQVGGLDEI